MSAEIICLSASVFVALIVAASVYAIVAESRTPRTSMTAGGFSVKSWMYKAELAWRDVTEVGLRDHLPKIILRTNGFAAGSKLRGRFEVAEMGSGQIFVDRKRPPFVVARTAQSFLIFNLEDAEKTAAVYAQLEARCTSARAQG